MNRLAPRALAGAFLIVAAASVIVPFLALMSAALQPSDTLAPKLEWPSDPQWSNFAEAWTAAGFASLIRSSAIIAVVVVPIALACATLAGYAMGTMRLKGKAVLFAFFIAGLTLPYEAIVIPLYFDFRAIGLIDTYWAVILPLAGAFMPFGIFWMRAYFESIPRELIEAAQLDGASSFRVLTQILLPTARPALVTLGLLNFMWAWNQFLLALILLRDPTMRTAPSGLGTFVQQFGENIPLLAAGTLIVIGPIVILYFIFQRHFISGMLQGSIK
ncbi:carbohydrate ABC transporter permease [Microbacterium sp. CPCC 204701]|uniref:carbohydrate ABC transporter permease n=1 Tax=Microbacterium sp. CPCC 204701 TaxID=2493084 RepID=UPI000FDAA39B|nr:carbohydrate ABC transporter permease [Microbacterium sp. CPCC 204701]